MKRPTDRRALLLAAGAAAVAAASMPAAAQPAEIGGDVVFEGGADIPKGELEVYLEDRGDTAAARRRVAATRLDSDGKAKAIAFSLHPPAGSATPATLRIVARLARADGWLIARGSAPVQSGSPVRVTLNTVMY